MLGKLMKPRTRVRDKHNLGLMILETDYDRLRVAASIRDRSVSALTRLIVTEWLDTEDRVNAGSAKSSPAHVPSKRAHAATKRVKGP